jgi:hypothetical protein
VHSYRALYYPFIHFRWHVTTSWSTSGGRRPSRDWHRW